MEFIDINQFQYNNKNPRKISDDNFEKLKRDIQIDPNFLKMNKLKVFPYNNKYIVYAGNMRLKALIELWYDNIPVEYISIDEDIVDEDWNINQELLTRRIFIDNESYGEYDKQLIIDNFDLEFIKGLDLPLLSRYVDEIEIDLLENDINDEVKDDIPELPADPVVQPWDIFSLWWHILVCWDSSDEKIYENVFGEEKYDLLVTDPPYNVNYEWTAGKIQNDNMDSSTFYSFLINIFQLCYYNQKEWWSYYIFHSDTEWANFRRSIQDVQYKLSECLVWVKDTIVMWRQDYHRQHEPILYGWKEGKAHSRYADRKQSTVLHFPKPTKSELHPTMKPVDMLMYLISNSSDKGDVVFDPFSWSWSIIIACETIHRRAVAIELDPRYVQAAIKRYDTYTTWKREIKCLNREIPVKDLLT